MGHGKLEDYVGHEKGSIWLLKESYISDEGMCTHKMIMIININIILFRKGS